MRYPIQPVYTDEHGTKRFRENKIVSFVLDRSREGGVGLNELARIAFPPEDWRQFTQLLGYSLRGWGDLSCVTDLDLTEAEEIASGKDARDARIAALEQELERVNRALEAMRKPLAELFSVAEEDLDPRRR